MRQTTTVLVVIDVASKRYTRFAGRTLTHQFYAVGHVEPYWVEMLRVSPELWEPTIEPEAA